MKIKHMFILLAASVSTASCGFLDECDPNATTVGNFYKSEADIVTSLNGVYASLTQSYYYTNNHYFTDVRSHDTAVTDSGANSGIPYQFYNYTLTEENSYVYNRYTQLFKTISRANTLLAHLDDVSYSNGDARNTYEAEIRFLRALTYFHLVTEWGDVPLILTELKTKDEVQANNYRRPKSEVYKAVFADLDYVLGSPLADMQPASESAVQARPPRGRSTARPNCNTPATRISPPRSRRRSLRPSKSSPPHGTCGRSANCPTSPTTRSGTSPRRSPAPRTFSRSTTSRTTPTSAPLGTTSSVPAKPASPRTRWA